MFLEINYKNHVKLLCIAAKSACEYSSFDLTKDASAVGELRRS